MSIQTTEFNASPTRRSSTLGALGSVGPPRACSERRGSTAAVEVALERGRRRTGVAARDVLFSSHGRGTRWRFRLQTARRTPVTRRSPGCQLFRHVADGRPRDAVCSRWGVQHQHRYCRLSRCVRCAPQFQSSQKLTRDQPPSICGNDQAPRATTAHSATWPSTGTAR